MTTPGTNSGFEVDVTALVVHQQRLGAVMDQLGEALRTALDAHLPEEAFWPFDGPLAAAIKPAAEAARSAFERTELHEIKKRVRRGDWAQPDSVVPPGATALLGPVHDPVDALAQTKIPGLVDQLRPLCEAQRWYEGDPAAVTGYLDRWHRVAELARQANELFDASVRRDNADCTGATGDGHRELATFWKDDLDMLVEAAESMIALVTAAGDLATSSRADILESVTQCVNGIVDAWA